MAKKNVEIDLGKELISVMGHFNGMHGAVDHNVMKIENELKVRGVSYEHYELEAAIVHLIQEKRIVIHFYTIEMDNTQPKFNVSLRTLCFDQ